MVDEATNVAHAVAVDDNSAVKVDAVVMTIIAILLSHASAKLLLTDNLTHVLRDKLTYNSQPATHSLTH